MNFGLFVLSRLGEDEYNNLKYTKTALAACSIIRENKQAPLPPLFTQVLGFRSGLLSLYVNRVAETHHDTASPPALIPNVHDLLPELNWLWKRGRCVCGGRGGEAVGRGGGGSGGGGGREERKTSGVRKL